MRFEIGALLGGTVRRLSHVNRYSSMPVSRLESVAEHSFYVAIFSLAVARDLERRGEVVDVARVLEGALTHDLDETVIGDLRRPVTDAIPGLRDGIDAVRRVFVAGVGREVGIEFAPLWDVHRELTLEGRIVRLADVLGVVAYLGEELRRGNEFVRGDVREVLEVLARKHLVALEVGSVLAQYWLEAHNWLDGVERGKDGGVPGDRELIARLTGGKE